MIKEALQYLIGLGNVETKYENGQTFTTQPIHLVDVPTPNTIVVRSLSGLVEYLQSEFDEEADNVMVQVKSPTEVICFSTLNNDFNRSEFIKTTAMIPSFDFERFHDPENFIIKLQSCFVINDDRDTILKVVGNIKDEAVNTYGDDGVSQSVVAKTGVATVANVAVPNPVSLAPYRTFVEVNQPQSDFIFRMKSGPSCALFEADGGAWKLKAMSNIKEYLAKSLAKEIENGKVVLIA